MFFSKIWIHSAIMRLIFCKSESDEEKNMMVSECVKSILSFWILLSVTKAASFKRSQTIRMFFGPPCPPPTLKTLCSLQYQSSLDISWKRQKKTFGSCAFHSLV